MPGGQEFAPRFTTHTESQDKNETVVDPETREHGKDVIGEIDELLDEIDDVLETNAEDFVRSYVQKGGQ